MIDELCDERNAIYGHHVSHMISDKFGEPNHSQNYWIFFTLQLKELLRKLIVVIGCWFTYDSTLVFFFKVQKPVLDNSESFKGIFFMGFWLRDFFKIIGGSSPFGFFLKWNFCARNCLILMFSLSMGTEGRIGAIDSSTTADVLFIHECYKLNIIMRISFSIIPSLHYKRNPTKK